MHKLLLMARRWKDSYTKTNNSKEFIACDRTAKHLTMRMSLYFFNIYIDSMHVPKCDYFLILGTKIICIINLIKHE